MTVHRYAAVDLGASSGRVLVAEFGPDSLDLREVHRFPNTPVEVEGQLRWDIRAIFREVLTGLRLAGDVDGIGIDSWAVDYGLLDAEGELLGDPVHYRDIRTAGVVEELARKFPDLWARTGVAAQPFNTIYQLAAEPLLPRARHLLLIPDLIAYWLTGEIGAEVTNASTTQLLNAGTRKWDVELMSQIGINPDLFPALRSPGELIGPLKPTTPAGRGVAGAGGAEAMVIAVASHDTASAVAAVPATGERFAYLSCGTWSLVGVETSSPILTEEARAAGFTNEAGLDGTVRFLRNVTGLWLLQECMRAWGGTDLEPLLAEAARIPARRFLIDANDPTFHPPGDMPQRIRAACRTAAKPETPAEVVRCVLDSLAQAHRDAVADASRLSGQAVEVVHMVGGGARNALLCQLTADACGLPVVAGPYEATALGNALVQARAAGHAPLTLQALRELIARTQPLRRYHPTP